MAVLLLVAAGAVLAIVGEQDIPWWSVDGGGGESDGGVYALRGITGQYDTGTMHGGGYKVRGGFWPSGLPADELHHRAYLPMVGK